MRKKPTAFATAVLLSCFLFAGEAIAGNDETGERLLAAAEGLQMPSSEADSHWSLVSFGGVEDLPEAATFEEISGCLQGGVTRQDLDETLSRLSEVEPWMDAGQIRSARGFRKLEKVLGREFEGESAVYRCDTGGPEIEVYFVGVDEDLLVGLMTVSIET